MSKVTWFGHSAFKVEANGVKLVIDPFLAPFTGFKPKDVGDVDIILITHDHGDHVGCAVEIARNTGALVGCMVSTAQSLINRGIPEKQIFNGIGYNIGGTLRYKNISATMTQAFHSSDSGAPAGYIVKMPDGLVFYHAGDTGIFSSMKLLGEIYGLQLAMLPVGGIFTMDAYQAANACKLLGCKQTIPMHWGTFPALAQNPDEYCALIKKFCPKCDCIVMEPGKEMEIAPLNID